MTATEDYKVGDTVKVSFEGKVNRVLALGQDKPGEVELRIAVGDDNHFIYTDTANVEKVSAPVEVFGPGDVVRNVHSRIVLLLGDDGWWNRTKVKFYPYGHVTQAGRRVDRDRFTSEDYERVDLS